MPPLLLLLFFSFRFARKMVLEYGPSV